MEASEERVHEDLLGGAQEARAAPVEEGPDGGAQREERRGAREQDGRPGQDRVGGPAGGGQGPEEERRQRVEHSSTVSDHEVGTTRSWIDSPKSPWLSVHSGSRAAANETPPLDTTWLRTNTA